jgi:putative MATE family efflux protein
MVFAFAPFTAVLIAGSLVAGKNILAHLGQDTEVVQLALPFMQLMSFSILPMLLFMTLKQFTDGLEFTKTAMLLSLAGMPVNILLNWLLIYGNWGFPRLELVGAGWATLITRTLLFSALCIIILRHRTFWRYVAVWPRQWNLRRQTLRELLGIGIPSSLQIGMEAGAFAVSGIIIGTISAVAQAAHQIALSCAAFTFMVSMGLAQAGSIRTSNAYGQGNWKKINIIGKSTLLTALGYGVFCALAFLTVSATGCRCFLTTMPRYSSLQVAPGVCGSFSNLRQYASDRCRAVTGHQRRAYAYVPDRHCVLDNRAAVGLPVGFFLWHGSGGHVGWIYSRAHVCFHFPNHSFFEKEPGKAVTIPMQQASAVG